LINPAHYLPRFKSDRYLYWRNVGEPDSILRMDFGLKAIRLRHAKERENLANTHKFIQLVRAIYCDDAV